MKFPKQKAVVISGALSGKIGYVEKSNKYGFVSR